VKNKSWVLKPLLSLFALELILNLVPAPDWWEAGIFDDYRYSVRINRWVEHKLRGEFNSEGYRDSEWSNPSLKPRVALFGDSRTFGLHVQEADTFGAQIEILSEWEALNMGKPGATPVEALDSMLPDALAYHPQAAVFFLDINSSTKSYVKRDTSGHRNNHIRHILRSFASWRLLEGLYHVGTSEPQPVLSLVEYQAHLKSCVQLLRDQDVNTIIMIIGYTPLQDFPSLWTQARYQKFLEVSRLVATHEGLSTIELESILRPMGDSGFIGEHQIHLSPDGHRELANSIIQHLNPDRK
jgi:hypothetical protein